MDKQILLISGWFVTGIISIVFASFSFIFLTYDKLEIVNSKNFRLYASLPKEGFQNQDQVFRQDARSKIVKDFFERYNAPLAKFSDYFVETSDKYDLDFRLLPAIAMQESSGGKKIIRDSFNPFGYGIYGGLVTRFDSFESAIERVARGLREDYLNQGLTTPYAIMTKYTPPSLAKGGPWAINVSSFMEEMR